MTSVFVMGLRRLIPELGGCRSQSHRQVSTLWPGSRRGVGALRGGSLELAVVLPCLSLSFCFLN